jgi:hypothetical protein
MQVVETSRGWYLSTPSGVTTFIRWENQLGGWVGYFDNLHTGLWQPLSPRQLAQIVTRFGLNREYHQSTHIPDGQ